MAANVQRSLLPDRFPELDDFSFSAFYEPCEAVGGDFHDVVTHEDRTVVLIADVIGHGIQAALSTMLLKGLFQEGAARSSSPVELLAEMSERLSRVLPDGMYTAASVFVLEHGSPEIQFSNAGLPYPFVLRKEGRLDEIVLGGSPLGLFPGSLSSYEARTLELAPGDVLLGGSDGLGSIHNGNEEFFKDRALRETLGELAGRDGKSVIEEAVKRARAFGGDRPLPDDVQPARHHTPLVLRSVNMPRNEHEDRKARKGEGFSLRTPLPIQGLCRLFG